MVMKLNEVFVGAISIDIVISYINAKQLVLDFVLCLSLNVIYHNETAYLIDRIIDSVTES